MKFRLCEHSEVDECLYKWFLPKVREGVPREGVIFEEETV
jgi:hypothetical protein